MRIIRKYCEITGKTKKSQQIYKEKEFLEIELKSLKILLCTAYTNGVLDEQNCCDTFNVDEYIMNQTKS